MRVITIPLVILALLTPFCVIFAIHGHPWLWIPAAIPLTLFFMALIGLGIQAQQESRKSPFQKAVISLGLVLPMPGGGDKRFIEYVAKCHATLLQMNRDEFNEQECALLDELAKKAEDAAENPTPGNAQDWVEAWKAAKGI